MQFQNCNYFSPWFFIYWSIDKTTWTSHQNIATQKCMFWRLSTMTNQNPCLRWSAGTNLHLESTSYFLSRVSNEFLFQTSTSSKHQIHHPNNQFTVSFSPMVTHIGRSNRKRTIHTSTTKKKDDTSYDISYRVSYFGLRKREWFAVVTAVVHRDPYRPFPQ